MFQNILEYFITPSCCIAAKNRFYRRFKCTIKVSGSQTIEGTLWLCAQYSEVASK